MMLRVILVAVLPVLIAASDKILMEQNAKISPHWLQESQPTPDGKIELTFAVKLNNVERLEGELMRVSSPSSSDYGKLLSYNEMTQLTAPKADSLLAVTSFLKDAGITDFQTTPGFVRTVVNIKTAETLLSAKYMMYKSAKTSVRALRCTEYSLPENVAAHVDFVSPTVNFPHSLTVVPEDKKMRFGSPHQNTPDSLRELYNVGDVMGGKASARQAATAFLHQYYSEDDLQSFYKEYFPELYGTPISDVVGPNGNHSGIEASLDVEYMTVMGAGVNTEFWSFAGRQPDSPENEPFLDWLVLLSDTADPPLVFSTSYGEDEDSVSLDYAERMNQEFQKNALRGISILFASGDSGVGSAFGPCTTYTPQFPSDSPYVTAVGATTGVEPETAAGLSSGGFSNRWARPSWQDDAVAAYFDTASATLPDAALYNASGRGFPDVSAQGTGYVVVSNGKTSPAVAGTSCSSPAFGGIIALLNDARIAAGKSPMGFLNPFIYQNQAVFNDVTSGNNPGCDTDGFQASAGWDPITGMGTPNYTKMVEAALALP